MDPARTRLLRVIARHRRMPSPTVSDLVAEVGGHPNTTRHHLRALAAAGLVVEAPAARAGGRGRPATGYRLTPAGRELADPSQVAAAQEYVALAAAFAERLAQRDGDPGADARAIGNAWGAGLVAQDIADAAPAGDGPATPGTATDRVLDLLDRLGFSPAVDATEDRTGTGVTGNCDAPREVTVLLRTCPLLDAARRHPDVVCEVHRGLVSGALSSLGAPSSDVALSPFARPGACVLGLPATLVG